MEKIKLSIATEQYGKQKQVEKTFVAKDVTDVSKDVVTFVTAYQKLISTNFDAKLSKTRPFTKGAKTIVTLESETCEPIKIHFDSFGRFLEENAPQRIIEVLNANIDFTLTFGGYEEK